MSRKKATGFEGEHGMVRVEWVDAAGSHGWEDKDEYLRRAGPLRIRTLGYIIRDDAEALVLAGSFDDDPQGTHRVPNLMDKNVIPRQCVVKVERLRVAGEHVKRKA